MKHISQLAAPLAIVLLATAALAQPLVTARVVLEDGGGLPTTVAAPGETIRVSLVASWAPVYPQLAAVRGDMLSTSPTASLPGTISNFSSPFAPGPVVNYGTVVGDDILGIGMATPPPLFVGGVNPLLANSAGTVALAYDWTAPLDAGIYDFDFNLGATGGVGVWYPSSLAMLWDPQNTLVIGARLFVLPAPATLALIAAVPLVVRRRREI